MIRARPQSFAAYGGGHMVFKIYRAGDLHNKPGKPGIFNVGRTHFYDVIEPRLEKACLGDRAVGYTDRSVERVQAEMIAEGPPLPGLPVSPKPRDDHLLRRPTWLPTN
jgi:hypothetical protein